MTKPKRGARLGQHFLIHAWAAKKLAHAAAPQSGETILEIGPGKGVLTRELLKLGRVLAIEKDPVLVEALRKTFSAAIAGNRLRIVEGDVRDVTPESLGLDHYIVAANIPYYITGEIIRQFLTATKQPRAMALLIQKEVAQRIVADKASILSLSVRAYGTPRSASKVARSHFSPQPSVDSAILLIDGISKTFFDTFSEEHFFEIVHAGFASKRKMIVNNLATTISKENIPYTLAVCGISNTARAEDLTLEQWKCLAAMSPGR